MSQELTEQEIIHKKSAQRAALMGMITNIIENEELQSVEDVRKLIISMMTRLIDYNLTINDLIEIETYTAIYKWGIGQEAIDDIKEFLK